MQQTAFSASLQAVPTVEENPQLRNMLIQHACSVVSRIQCSANAAQTNARNVSNSALESMEYSVESRDNLFVFRRFLNSEVHFFFTLLYDVGNLQKKPKNV